MATYGEESNVDLQFEKRDAVAILSNLTEQDVNYHTLSRIVKRRLTPLLETLYNEGRCYYHISLTSRRDILVGEELVKFKRSHPNTKLILFETTLSPESSGNFTESDVRRYRRIYSHFDIFVFHPIAYGEDKCQQLNISFSKDVDTVIAYGDCRSSAYLCNHKLDVRYLLTDSEMWPDEFE